MQLQLNDLSPHPPVIEVKPWLLSERRHLALLTSFGAILHGGNGKLELWHRAPAEECPMALLTF